MALKDSRPSLEAEQAVVGSLLVAGSSGDAETIRGLLSAVQEEDLLNPVNKAVFQAARALFRSGGAVDPITIRDKIGGQYSKPAPAHGDYAHHRQLAGVDQDYP